MTDLTGSGAIDAEYIQELEALKPTVATVALKEILEKALRQPEASKSQEVAN